MAIFRCTGHSRETHRSYCCIASKRFYQRGNILCRRVCPLLQRGKVQRGARTLFSRARLRTVSGSASAGLPSSSEYDPLVSTEKRRIAARLFQIILLAHSPALLRETSFLHRRAEVFCAERCNFFRCFRGFRKIIQDPFNDPFIIIYIYVSRESISNFCHIY